MKIHNLRTKKFYNIWPQCQGYKTSLSCEFSKQARVFVPCKPLKPSLMFVGKARGLFQSEAPESCFNWVSSGLTSKYYTRLESLARGKPSSLLRKSVNYGRKRFYSTGPWCQGYKTFYSRKSVCPLQAFPGQFSVCGYDWNLPQ